MHRRIEEPGDFVRLEVEAALNLDKRVVPLLVRQATMPAEDELPGTIARLAYQNGIAVRADPDFDNDITRLLSGLSRLS